MTRIIACVSGKGGAGKTTLVANIGTAIAEIGKDIIVVDTNLTTPNLGIHLGVPLYPTTLHDVLKGHASIKDAIYEHDSGLKVIPAGLSMRDLRGADIRDLSNTLLDLLGNAEIIMLDSAAGLGREALTAMETADEILIVTNPDLPSVTDALKAARLAEQTGTKIIGAVINRATGKPHELTKLEIQSMLENIDILATIPEDISVQRALSRRTPVIHHSPASRASHQIRSVAAQLVGYEYKIPVPWYRRILLLRR